MGFIKVMENYLFSKETELIAWYKIQLGFLLLLLSRWGLSMFTSLASYSWRSSCFYLPSNGIKGVCYHTQPDMQSLKRAVKFKALDRHSVKLNFYNLDTNQGANGIPFHQNICQALARLCAPHQECNQPIKTQFRSENCASFKLYLVFRCGVPVVKLRLTWDQPVLHSEILPQPQKKLCNIICVYVVFCILA